jgi:hypothetical protein
MTITIEKNVPIPKTHERGNKKYPFDEMDVGDSFTCDTPNINNSVRFYAKRNEGKKFTTRKVGEAQWRVWRTA